MTNSMWTPADIAAWRVAAEAALKGGSIEERLTSTSLDGLKTPSLGVRELSAHAISAAGTVGGAPFTRGTYRQVDDGWVIAQRADVPGVSDANRQMLEDLNEGASGLVVDLAAIGASPKALQELFDGVHVDLIPITFEPNGTMTLENALAFLDLAKTRRIEADQLRFHPGFCAALMDRDTFTGAVRTVASLGLQGPIVMADGRPWHEAGATEAEELGIALASAILALRLVTDAGLGGREASSRIAFKLSVDADQFRSIAKIRACRLLWASALSAAGLEPVMADVRVELGQRGLTKRDPWVNILRATIAGFAGAVGGASELVLHPFTSQLGVPDGEARRLARNTQLILRDECGLSLVADPGGGSATLETLTLQLADAAWRVMQNLEAAGGLDQALAQGIPQALAARSAAIRAERVATRRIAITGLSEFPNVDEVPPDTLGPVLALSAPDLAPRRPQGEAFEALRARADAETVAQAGQRPLLFLAALGQPSDTIARATFSRAFVEAGGFASHVSPPLADTDALLAAYKGSGAKAVILCSSDEVYAERATASAIALKQAGADLVWMAGKPADTEALRQAGIDGFIHVGVDVVAVLSQLQAKLFKAKSEVRA